MILVTGGAGYIGSQVVLQMQDAGKQVVVLDSLITGDRRAVQNCPFYQGNVGDKELLQYIFKKHPIEAVMHFAACTIVPESVVNPLKYYLNNTANTAILAQACLENQIKYFVFSSTAAVYGVPPVSSVTEDALCEPINPYGASKQFSEKILTDLCNASAMRGVILRYFNVAGADPSGRIGPYLSAATLLIRVAVQVALGKRDKLIIYGNDYQTADGTGVRDYVHVADIAAAHIQALDYLYQGGRSEIFNCGYGHGFSVKQVVDAVSEVCGHDIPCEVAERRAGDPDSIIADSRKIKDILKWQPRYDDLLKIVRDAYEWEKRLRF